MGLIPRVCSLQGSADYPSHIRIGSLYTDETKSWNVAHLPSTLSRLLPPGNGLPGVNTPYLYFGMWRATFAWHVEDMDLFSINYVHFGAPKFWYSVPQGRASALEQTMRGNIYQIFYGFRPYDVNRLLSQRHFTLSTILASQVFSGLSNVAGTIILSAKSPRATCWRIRDNIPQRLSCGIQPWLQLCRKCQFCPRQLDRTRKTSQSM